MSAPLLEVRDLSFRYQHAAAAAIRNVSFSVGESEAVVVVGGNGSGKSTLLNCLCGIVPHVIKGRLSGSVAVCGRDTVSTRLPELAGTMGFVFQHPDTQLFCANVRDEISFGPENMRIEPGEINTRCEHLLEALNLTPVADRDPSTLSGGEKQRVAIAAVLAMQPKILLMDEPWSHLDSDGRLRTGALLRAHMEAGGALVVATPSLDSAPALGTRTLRLAGGAIESGGTV